MRNENENKNERETHSKRLNLKLKIKSSNVCAVTNYEFLKQFDAHITRRHRRQLMGISKHITLLSHCFFFKKTSFLVVSQFVDSFLLKLSHGTSIDLMIRKLEINVIVKYHLEVE